MENDPKREDKTKNPDAGPGQTESAQRQAGSAPDPNGSGPSPRQTTSNAGDRQPDDQSFPDPGRQPDNQDPDYPEPLPDNPEPLFDPPEPLPDQLELRPDHPVPLPDQMEPRPDHPVPLPDHPVPLPDQMEPLLDPPEPLLDRGAEHGPDAQIPVPEPLPGDDELGVPQEPNWDTQPVPIFDSTLTAEAFGEVEQRVDEPNSIASEGPIDADGDGDSTAEKSAEAKSKLSDRADEGGQDPGSEDVESQKSDAENARSTPIAEPGQRRRGRAAFAGILGLVVGFCAGVAAWYFINAYMFETVADDSLSAEFTITTLGQGDFQDAGFFHRGSGRATLYESVTGSRVLRLSDFNVTNGPGLELRIVAGNAIETSNDVIVSDWISLGPLKGNVGDQVYAIPEGTDAAEYPYVVVWSRPFGLIFATAELQAAE